MFPCQYPDAWLGTVLVLKDLYRCILIILQQDYIGYKLTNPREPSTIMARIPCPPKHSMMGKSKTKDNHDAQDMMGKINKRQS